ncbi:hypothetical protein LPW36_09660 [Jinshanibacter sp. LJY008]|uniref:Uncharacterized protein n=1 Tax=Limnobaculum eriocheiris TaxID=2897391 RepID=A0A9X1MX82_9GAMM|nr:hypothetical protein [Limnobaculum eriocheiris]MCD1126263.1 hypothetical protein [Limnobaculum eriocheiris]
MHNYIINDRVMFNTFTGGLSRLDDPRKLNTLSSNAKRLFLHLIDSGYQIVPFEQLTNEIEEKEDVSNTAKAVISELSNITKTFHQLGEFEPILTIYSYGVQLSTDVELKVITSYRTFSDDSKEKPYIAKKSLINSATANGNNSSSSTLRPKSRFVWYYTRIMLVAALFIFIFYFALNMFTSKPGYFADYHHQEKYQQCDIFIHNQIPTDLANLKMRLDELSIACDKPKNVYFSIPADDRRESIQVCDSDPDRYDASCFNFYVVKVK